MNKYLGETDITDSVDTSDKTKMALLYIEMYGGIDGDHHKTWLIDQVARILNDVPITVKRAAWEDGTTELRYSVGSNDKYMKWVYDTCYGEDGAWTYNYNEGIAP